MLRTSVRNPDAASSSTDVPCAMEEGTVDIEQLYATLREYLLLEHKFQPKLYLPANPEHGEVSSGARDGAAHILRCLKMWYDLPADVLLHAINLLDRFLTKMKVRPCHIPCITVSCMNIAIETYAANNKNAQHISIEELVSISQSTCTPRDVARMSSVVRDKLALVPGAPTITALHWLRLFRSLIQWAARSLQIHSYSPCPESELVNLLEIVACDAACVNARTCELALVLLYNRLESQVSEWQQRAEAVPEDVFRLLELVVELQRACSVPDASLLQTRALVGSVLARYDAHGRSNHRQRLVWRLSSRTLKVLRPTDRLTSRLPTIEEQQNLAPEGVSARPRSGSESSDDLSEDTKDWPRSPVLPVYCDN